MVIGKTNSNWFFLAVPSLWMDKIKEYCRDKPILKMIAYKFTEKSNRSGKLTDKGQGLYFLFVDDKTKKVTKKTWNQILK
jgi:hypothetical protein